MVNTEDPPTSSLVPPGPWSRSLRPPWSSWRTCPGRSLSCGPLPSPALALLTSRVRLQALLYSTPHLFNSIRYLLETENFPCCCESLIKSLSREGVCSGSWSRGSPCAPPFLLTCDCTDLEKGHRSLDNWSWTRNSQVFSLTTTSVSAKVHFLLLMF